MSCQLLVNSIFSFSLLIGAHLYWHDANIIDISIVLNILYTFQLLEQITIFPVFLYCEYLSSSKLFFLIYNKPVIKVHNAFISKLEPFSICRQK